MTLSNQFVVWDEPSPFGKNRRMRISTNLAIIRQKRAAKKLGHRYMSDSEALSDFLLIHWAWLEPAEKG